MLNEAIRILSSIMKTLGEENKPLEAFRFFDIAVICGSVEGRPLDGNRLQFTLAGTERIVYDGCGHHLRFIFAQIGLNVDEIRFPEVGKPTDYMAEEIAQEAERLGIPLYLPEDEIEDFHARLVREQTGKKMPPRRLGQVYANFSSRRRRELSKRGVEWVNKYGFEASIDYLDNNGVSVPLKVKVSNDGVSPPLCFCIEKLPPPVL